MEKRIYKAEEGKTYRRKSDNKIMGNRMILGKFVDGTEDDINNYEEITDETPAKTNRRTRHSRPHMDMRQDRMMELRERRNRRR